jgi:outer membrane protein W
MKKMKQLIILGVLAMIAGITQVNAQHHSTDLVAVSWEMAFPSNNNYLNKTSYAGGRVEYRKLIKDQFSVGLGISWNSFEDYVGTKTYTSNGGGSAVTTDMVRYIYTVPMTATFHYYPTVSNKLFKPYVGVGLGTQYAEQYSYFNIYQLGSNNWGFVVRPEIGTLVRVGHLFSLMVTGSYQYASNKNDDLHVNNLSQFAINIGGAWGF